MMEVVVTTGAIKRAKIQIVTNNKPTPSFFTGRVPFLSPNQQRQSTEGTCICITIILCISQFHTTHLSNHFLFCLR